ncbi:hypothetical protein NEMBOFW57_006355 [Staphylotrichum longicolle]|uniref:Hydantoin racemase n=1 Tax=Staphylotrichum longicolle TaxID=669026 RepID=A0AAD4EYK2_9PEZI|nr:hypothetical protein NEMBOFW57_006355 [Staphylotrichum longicolle]
MATTAVRRTTKILVLNPNSSKSMTHGLHEAIRGLELSQSTEVHTYTAPSASPASINDGEDVLTSARVVESDLAGTGLLKQYDAVIVACFSVHPLVGMLAEKEGEFGRLAVTGIFEASDFHGGVDPETVRQKLRDATTRLLEKGDVECVVMGCAGMAGLEEIIRSVAVEKYGPSKANQLLVIDGVRAGLGLLEQMMRTKRAFQST